MASFTDRLTDKHSQDLAQKFASMFATLPHLPKNITEFLVNFAPIFALIGAVLSLVAGPVLGILGVISLITLNPFLVFSTLLAAVLSLVTAVILFVAYKPLQARQYNGWMLLFWSSVISAAESLLQIVLHGANVSSLIGMLIGFYILFEMRPFYGIKGKIADVVTKAKEHSHS